MYMRLDHFPGALNLEPGVEYRRRGAFHPSFCSYSSMDIEAKPRQCVNIMILERLRMTFTANGKVQDEIFFLPKHGET